MSQTEQIVTETASAPISEQIVKIAVPVPLRKAFDYRAVSRLVPGTRVVVPFARRTLVGVVVPGEADTAPINRKAVGEVLDSEAVITGHLLELVIWSARYYQHPIGEVSMQLSRHGSAAITRCPIPTW